MHHSILIMQVYIIERIDKDKEKIKQFCCYLYENVIGKYVSPNGDAV